MYVNTKEILLSAKSGKYSIVAADVWNLDSASIFVETAIENNMPLIVMFAETNSYSIADAEEVCVLVKYLASKTDVPIAMQLDHGTSVSSIIKSSQMGFSSVMIDASKLPFEENVIITKEIVRIAHACNITVEAELGHVGTGLKINDTNVLTVPEEAKEFVKQTNVDSLAVAIGTVHGPYKEKPNIDVNLLRDIANIVDVPLVLHGGSGTGMKILKEVSMNGISKINVFTDLYLASKNAINDEDTHFNISMRDALKKCLKTYFEGVSKPWII